MTNNYNTNNQITFSDGKKSWTAYKTILALASQENSVETRYTLDQHFNYDNWRKDVDNETMYAASDDFLYYLKGQYHGENKYTIPLTALTGANILTYFHRIGGGAGTATGTESDPIYIFEKDIDGLLAANSDLKIATQKAVKTYVDAEIAKITEINAPFLTSGNGVTPAILAANATNFKANSLYEFNADVTLATSIILSDGSSITTFEKGQKLQIVKTGATTYAYTLIDANDKVGAVCVISPATNIVANGTYTFNHNLNDLNPIIQGYDGAGVVLVNQQNIAFTVVDANNVLVEIGSIPVTGFKMKVCGGAMVTYTAANGGTATVVNNTLTSTSTTEALSANQGKVLNDTILSTNTAQDTIIASKLTANTQITGATKTKITYDSKGLVTSGADATATDILTTPITASPTSIALTSTNQQATNAELATAIKNINAGADVIIPAAYPDLTTQITATANNTITQNSTTKDVVIKDTVGDTITILSSKRLDLRKFIFSTGSATLATHFADNNEDTEFVTLLTGETATVKKVTLNINLTTGTNTASTIVLKKKTGATIVDYATITVPANATVTNGVAIAGTIITTAGANILADNDQLLVTITAGSLTAVDFTINTLIHIA